ncbi:MAG TPA: ABC transporter permease [Acetobacteraceae bacterium]|jgi:NitT/TauT family transport system permease protein|nr:ABC transporter permease [Acetobacteraceae bacterium]
MAEADITGDPVAASGPELPTAWHAASRNERITVILWRIGIAITIVVAWQAASGRLIKPFWISSPLAIWDQLVAWAITGELLMHVEITLAETLMGFVFGAVAGIAMGLALGLNRRVAAVLDPFIVAFYSLPKIALAPLFILWFGVGMTSKVVMATFVVFFLVFYNTYAGTLAVEQELVDVLRLMGARRWQIVTKVILPSVAIWIFTGMKTSVPYALIGAVVGEMMASNKGLGYLIQAAAGQYDTGGVFAALFVLAIIAMLLHTALKHAELWLLRWKEEAR